MFYKVRIRTYSKGTTKSTFNLEPLESTLLYYTVRDHGINLRNVIKQNGAVWVVGHYPRTMT